jgi:hypothetical protein
MTHQVIRLGITKLPTSRLLVKTFLDIVRSHMITITKEMYRERYLKMAKSTGVDQAITEIHRELGKLEPRVFDGGYDKEKFDMVQFFRELARELYNIKLSEASTEYYQEK